MEKLYLFTKLIVSTVRRDSCLLDKNVCLRRKASVIHSSAWWICSQCCSTSKFIAMGFSAGHGCRRQYRFLRFDDNQSTSQVWWWFRSRVRYVWKWERNWAQGKSTWMVAIEQIKVSKNLKNGLQIFVHNGVECTFRTNVFGFRTSDIR